MTVTFAEKLARMPGYQAGVPTGQAPEAIAAGGIAQLASNESPFPPHPKVVEAIQRRRRGDEPLPGPRRDAAAPAPRRALRDRARPGRGRQRLLRDPARRRRGALRAGRRDPLRLAGLLDVPVPAGADRRPRDPRAAGRGRRARPRGDGGRGDRGDPAAAGLQPQQPDRHPPAGGRGRRLLRADPAPTSRSSSTRPTSSSRPTTTPTPPSTCSPSFPNLVVLRTFSKCYGLAGLRVGYAIGSPKFRAAVDAVRQPFSVNALAQAAGAEAILHQDDVARRVESTIAERHPGRGGAARDRPPHRRDPGQLLLGRPRRGRGGRGRRRPRRSP